MSTYHSIKKHGHTSELDGGLLPASAGGPYSAFTVITADSGTNATADSASDFLAINGGTAIATVSGNDPEVITINLVTGDIDHGSLNAASLLDDDHTIYLLIDGTRAMTGNLDMGGYVVKNLAALQGTFNHTILAMTDDASALYHLLIVAGTAGDPNVTLRPAGGTDIGLVLDPAGTSHISLNGKTDITDDVTIAAAGKLIFTDSATFAPLNLTERGTAPTTPSTGDIYLDNGTNYNSGGGLPGFMRYTGSAWEDIGNDGGGGGGASQLTDLSDVDTAAQTSGYVLQTSGANYFGGQLAHTALSAIGTNTHAQIDTHIASTSNPHSVTAAQVGALENVVEDTNPQLGGNLDVNNKSIVTNSTNKDMQFKCNTSGQIYVQAKHWEIGRITGAMPVDNASGNGAYGQAYVGGGTPACVHRGFIFNDSTDYYLDLSGILHYDYNLTDPIDWHLMVAAVSAASGTIEMKITVAPVDGGTTDLDNNIFSSSTEVAGTATVSSAGKVEEIIIALSNSQMASIAGGSCFVARIRRNSSVSGDVTGDVILFPQFCRVCCGTSAT